MLTLQQLQNIYPKADHQHLVEFEKQHELLFDKYKIQNSQVTKFMAQIGHESGGLQFMEENLNYSARGLRRIWRHRFPTVSIANAYARNPQKIANKVYANRMGNGPESSGDGWKHRGHGYIQLTGKDAYIKVGNIIGLALVSNPKLATDPQHALEVVCGVWVWKGLHRIDNFVTMTKRINGGLHGLSDRRRWLRNINKIVKIQSKSYFYTNSNTSVIEVQKALRENGYKDIVGTADGILGNMTKSAIKQFKTDNNLKVNTDIDDDLLIALKLKGGELNTKLTEDLILKIQKELNNKGYEHLVGIADGIMGNMTRAGIKKFRLDNDLGNNSDIDDELLAALGI